MEDLRALNEARGDTYAQLQGILPNLHGRNYEFAASLLAWRATRRWSPKQEACAVRMVAEFYKYETDANELEPGPITHTGRFSGKADKPAGRAVSRWTGDGSERHVLWLFNGQPCPEGYEADAQPLLVYEEPEPVHEVQLSATVGPTPPPRQLSWAEKARAIFDKYWGQARSLIATYR